MLYLLVKITSEDLFAKTLCISDAGCNVGMYSIVAAAIGRNVVAVDAMADNLAYIRKSLELNNMSEKVVLVHNAIR